MENDDAASIDPFLYVEPFCPLNHNCKIVGSDLRFVTGPPKWHVILKVVEVH
jgi:hypothetical protein